MAVVCALAGCGAAAAPVGPVAAGPARCDPADVLHTIANARLRAQLARLGPAHLVPGDEALDGGGAHVDETVAVVETRDDAIRIAVDGHGVTLLVWVPRADLAPVTLVEHRVVETPGGQPLDGGLGVTVFPGHPVERGGAAGWVRVRGRGDLAFDGWIPDDYGQLWEPAPPRVLPAGEVWVERGASLVGDPGGRGRALARLERARKARLLESVVLGADKVEIADTTARVVGYVQRPRLVPRQASAGELHDEDGLPGPRAAARSPHRADDRTEAPPSAAQAGERRIRECLRDGAGGPVVGVIDGAVLALDPAALAGWSETPIATPWGTAVLAVRTPR